MRLCIRILLIVSVSVFVANYGNHHSYEEKYEFLKHKYLQRLFEIAKYDAISYDDLEKLVEECKENYHTQVFSKGARKYIDCNFLIRILEGTIKIDRGIYDLTEILLEEISEEAITFLAPYKIKQLEYKIAETQKKREHEIAEAQKKIDFLSKNRKE